MDKNLELYLSKVSNELSLLRKSLTAVEEEKGKTLARILNTLSQAKQKENKEKKVCPFCQQDVQKRVRNILKKKGILVIEKFQLEVLRTLKEMAKLDTLHWPDNFKYHHYFWDGYGNCFDDVSKIIGLEGVKAVSAEKAPKRQRLMKRGRPIVTGLEGALEPIKEVS
jgi:hypothetical protein